MSHQAVRAVLATTGSKGSARCVLIALAYHADDDGRCFPSIDTIAAEANVCRRTAQSMLAELEGDGEIVVDRNAGPRGVNVYRIVACTAQDLHPADLAPPVQDVAPVQLVAPVQAAAHKESYSSFGSKDPQEDTTRKAKPKRPFPVVATDGPSERAATTKPTRTAKPKAPPDPRVKALTEALAEWQGYTACNWPAEAKAAKRIIDAGYTVDDARTVWRRMKGEAFWADKHLPLASVFNQLGAKLGGPNGRKRDVIVLEPIRRGGAS